MDSLRVRVGFREICYITFIVGIMFSLVLPQIVETNKEKTMLTSADK